MKTSNQIRYIATSLGGANYIKLVKIAQSLDEKSFDLEKARRTAPQYWKRLGLERYKDAIKQALNTSAEPNSDEFLKAVYQYQKVNPQTGPSDGILGDLTFGIMSSKDREAFPAFIPAGQTNSQDLWGKDTKEQVKQLGLVSLVGVAPIKNNPYAHPKLRQLFEQLSNASAPIAQITEAFPATSPHQSTTHSNGRAVDFTLTNPNYAQAVVNYINKIPGYRAINEYARQSAFSTGGHVHVQMTDESQLIS